MSERKSICLCNPFLIDVRLTHTNTHTHTHTEIKATQAGAQQIKRTAAQTQNSCGCSLQVRMGCRCEVHSLNLEGKKTPWWFHVILLYQHSVHTNTHTHTHTHWMCLKLQRSDCHIDSEASPSPLLAIHALVSFLLLISAVLSQPQQRSTYQPRWLKINFIAISKPSARAVYGLIHLCLPNYWSVSEKKMDHSIIWFLFSQMCPARWEKW